MVSVDFATTTDRLGEIVEAVGKAMRESRPHDGLGQLMMNKVFIDSLEVTDAKLKLSIVSCVELNNVPYNVGDKVVTIKKLVVRKLNIELNALPVVEDGLLVLYDTQPK